MKRFKKIIGLLLIIDLILFYCFDFISLSDRGVFTDLDFNAMGFFLIYYLFPWSALAMLSHKTKFLASMILCIIDFSIMFFMETIIFFAIKNDSSNVSLVIFIFGLIYIILLIIFLSLKVDDSSHLHSDKNI